MEKLILMKGSKAIFLPAFGAAVVAVKPGTLEGSGPATLKGRKLCVVGDEGDVSVADCVYMTPQYCIPGKGTLKISGLNKDQEAKKTKTGDTAVILKGTKFDAKFEVKTPAKQPPPGPGSPIPDPTQEYSGKGMFTTTNKIFKGA